VKLVPSDDAREMPVAACGGVADGHRAAVASRETWEDRARVGATGEHMRDKDLEGKVVLITGGSVGIGRELALIVAQRGGHAVACGRNQERLDALARDAEVRSLEVMALRGDVAI
jgi:FlaA1/EpsC-like NDP-sugar epimerase